MAERDKDAHLALDQIVQFRNGLSRQFDGRLVSALNRLTDVFKSRLFLALLDIRNFYETTLLDPELTNEEKAICAMDVALRWENTSGPSLTASTFDLRRSGSPSQVNSLDRPLPQPRFFMNSSDGDEHKYGQSNLRRKPENYEFADSRNSPLSLSTFNQSSTFDSPRIPLHDSSMGNLNPLKYQGFPNHVEMRLHSEENDDFGVYPLKTLAGRKSQDTQRPPIKPRHRRLDHPKATAITKAERGELTPTRVQQLQIDVTGDRCPWEVNGGRKPVDTVPLPRYSSNIRTLFVLIARDANGFGFSIAGGRDGTCSSQLPRDIYITRIQSGGVAERDGLLQLGDRIVAVNGVSLLGLTHDEAVTILQKAGPCLNLTIERSSFEEKFKMSTHQPAEFCLTQTTNESTSTGQMSTTVVTTTPSAQSSSSNSSVPLASKHVLPQKEKMSQFSEDGENARRNHSVGQQRPTRRLPSQSSFTALSWCTGLQKATSTMVGCAPLARNSGGANGASRSDSSDTHVVGLQQTPEQQSVQPPARAKLPKRQAKARPTSPDRMPWQTSQRPLPMPLPGPVVVEVNLCRAERSGLGFSIAGGSDNQVVPGDSGIFVTKLTSGGIAETDARITVGDRIVQVNEVSLVDVTHAQAVKALKRAGDDVNLIVVKKLVQAENEVAVELHGGGPKMMEDPEKVLRRVSSAETLPSSTSAVKSTTSKRNSQPPDHLLSQGKANEDSSTPKPQEDKGTQGCSPKLHHPSQLRLPHIPGYQQAVLGSQVAGLVDYEAAASMADLVTQWPSARLVTLFRSTVGHPGIATTNTSFGLNIVGGDGSEATFISQVQPDKPAGISKKISVGDRLLAVNGIDVSRHGHEKAAASLRQAEDRVDLVLVHCPQDFADFQQCFFQQLNAIGQDGATRTQRRHRRHRRSPGTGERRHRSSTTCTSPQTPVPVHPLTVDGQQHQQPQQSTLSPGSPLSHVLTCSEHPGRQQQPFLLRCLVDYDPSRESNHVVPKKALIVRSGDLFSVINHEDQEWWQAQKIDPVSGHVDSHIGIIPSRARLERRERISRKHVNFPSKKRTSGCSFGTVSPSLRSNESNNWRTRDNYENRVASVPSLSTNPDSKSTEEDFAAQSTVHEDGTNKSPVLTYNPVTPVQLSFPRPVVILGHMKDRIADELLCAYPDRFGTVVPYTTRPCRPNEVEGREYHFVVSRETMVADIAAQRYLEAGEYRGNLYGTHMESVFEVAGQGLHCLLDIGGPALRRLTSSGLPPVAVLILPEGFPLVVKPHGNSRPQSASKSSQGCGAQPGAQPAAQDTGVNSSSLASSTDGSTANLQAKLASLMQNFSAYLTGIIISDDFDEAYARTKELIWENAGPLVWLSVNSKPPLC